MKKVISALIVLASCMMLSACGNVANNEIGKTYTLSNIELTLNYVDFTDVMDNWGGANDTYWMPLPDDAFGHQLENAVCPKSADDTICVISYTVKNISKRDMVISDSGTLDYDNGYQYSDGSLAVRLTEDGVWSKLSGGIVLKKLDTKSYEFRAYMVVPKVIVTDVEKPLSYTLFGEKYILR